MSNENHEKLVDKIIDALEDSYYQISLERDHLAELHEGKVYQKVIQKNHLVKIMPDRIVRMCDKYIYFNRSTVKIMPFHPITNRYYHETFCETCKELIDDDKSYGFVLEEQPNEFTIDGSIPYARKL